jgi:hypothetical protein
MNSIVFESLSALGPVPLSGAPLELIGLGISALIALILVAYLLRCYFQEFRRAQRVRHRKRLASLQSLPPEADRKRVVEGCLRRRASVMASEIGGLPELDWRGLHSLIPSHDRITLVWDTGLVNDDAPPRLCVDEAAEDEAVTGYREVTIR